MSGGLAIWMWLGGREMRERGAAVCGPSVATSVATTR